MDVGLAHHPIDWLDDPHLALPTALIANIWLGVPFFTLLLYSALQEVPVEVKEAALMDGAGPWQRLRLIIVPIILPVIEVTLLLGFVFTVKVFDLSDRPYRRRPGQRYATHHDMVLQPVVPAVLLWRRRRAQQRAARAGDDLLAVVPVAQPGFLEEQLGSREMTRLQRSRALRWLCTLATVAALVIVLFPVYAVIVGSFESTDTLFSGNVLLAAARGDARQLPDRHPGAIGQRADEPHRRRWGQQCWPWSWRCPRPMRWRSTACG